MPRVDNGGSKGRRQVRGSVIAHGPMSLTHAQPCARTDNARNQPYQAYVAVLVQELQRENDRSRRNEVDDAAVTRLGGVSREVRCCEEVGSAGWLTSRVGWTWHERAATRKKQTSTPPVVVSATCKWRGLQLSGWTCICLSVEVVASSVPYM